MTAMFFRRAARNRVGALRITIVACLALMAKAAMVVDGVPLFAEDQQEPAWEMTNTVSLDGLEISLSKPRLVARSQRYLWFPTMYGYFKGEQRYSLVMVESTDGLAWKFRSLIAGFDCTLAGGEGPCESQTVRLKDGRLMNVFRLASSVPYGQTFSDDDGRTWSAPVAMKEAHSVQPSIALMKDGALVLTGGRPGIFAWLNRAGDGQHWMQVDLQSHHNEHHAQDAITRADQTTSYTEVVALDEQSVLVMYDRIPHGWNAIPEGSKDTNSIWVVKVSWK